MVLILFALIDLYEFLMTLEKFVWWPWTCPASSLAFRVWTRCGYGWRCSFIAPFCRVRAGFSTKTTVRATSCCQVARCIHMRRVSRAIPQLHQYALLWALRISWLCPEHDLKLFTRFCVCRRNSSTENSEGQPVFQALHVQNESIWYGLEGLSCIPSLLSTRLQEMLSKPPL